MKNITFIGGDFRQLIAAEEFKKDGCNVKLIGFDKEYIKNSDFISDDITYFLSQSDVVIFGLPAFSDDKTVNTPLYSNKIYIDDLIESINNNTVITGGMLNASVKNKLNSVTDKVYDYFEREELIIKNVIPTVEGAVAIAVNETPVTLHNSNCLVTGYGRIGKYLSDVLSKMGCNVTVSARKKSDFAWITLHGFEYINSSELLNNINKFDIIFNTVPVKIFDKEVIDSIKKDAIIIDLASKPGGCDLDYAGIKGIKIIWALSLPGKTAPVTAGKIIKETIENILDELGVL